MANMISGIVSLSLGVVVLANVFIMVVKEQCLSGWATSEVSMWGLLTLAGIIGLVFGTLSVFGIV